MSERIVILIIDDEADFVDMVEYNLKLDGFKPMGATSGPEGLILARECHPQLILLDTTMPEMDGMEVLSELKYNPATKDIPVFMLTAKTMLGDIELAFEIGADDYITKPIELRKLGKVIKRKLEKLSDRKAGK